DPVGSGFVSSLARPGGNVTGLSLLSGPLAGKRLELLQAMVPQLSRVIALGAAWNVGELTEAEAAARSLGLAFELVEVSDIEDVERAFTATTVSRADGILVLVTPVTV